MSNSSIIMLQVDPLLGFIFGMLFFISILNFYNSKTTNTSCMTTQTNLSMISKNSRTRQRSATPPPPSNKLNIRHRILSKEL